MSVKSAVEKGKLKQEKELREKELDLQREGQKKTFISSIAGSVSSLIPKGKYTLGNGPIWYKQYIKDVECVTNIPTWLKVSKPNVQVCGGIMSASSSIATFNKSASGLFYHGGNMLTANIAANPQKSGSTARVVVHKFMPHVGYNDEFAITGTTGATPVHQRYPINRATLMTITELGKLNSRAIPNDPSIPGMYLLGGTEIYSFLAELKFVIDTVTHYQANDDTIPDAILRGKGYDPKEVRSNLPSYRKVYRIVREYALSSVPLPDDFTLLARRIWMNTVIIRDTDVSKSAIVLFAQEAFGIVSEDGTELLYSSFNNNANTAYVKQSILRIEGYLNTMITNMATNEEFLTLISNMRAANIKFAPIPELEYQMDYEIQANDEVKLQLQNIVTFPSCHHSLEHLPAPQLAQWGVYHDIDGYIYGPNQFKLFSDTIDADGKFTSTAQAGRYLRAYGEVRILSSFSKLFNSFIGWDTDKMLVATRLHPLYSGIAQFNGDTRELSFSIMIGSCGTELVLDTQIYWVMVNDDYEDSLTFTTVHSVALNAPNVTLSGNVYTVTYWGNTLFIESPIVRNILHVDGFYNIYVLTDSMNGFSWDVSDGSIVTDANLGASILFAADDYISIERSDLARVHEVCVLSEFFIPAKNFGSFTRSK